MRLWRHLLGLLFLAALCLPADAQGYTVLYCKSQCKRFQNGRPVKTGETILPSEKLDLGNGSGKMVLWSKEEGITLLAPHRDANGKLQLTGLVAQLKEPLPAKLQFGERVASLADLQGHFQKRNYLILDETWLLVDRKFRLTGDTVLFFQFESPKADIRVSRRVEHRGDSLLLHPRYILDMNGKPVPANDAANFHLYWLDMRNKGYSALASFEFVFADGPRVREEVAALIALLEREGKRPREEVFGAVQQFLAAAYGVPDPHNLRRWLDRNFPG